MKWLKSLRLIIGVHTLVITLLAVASTWLCLRYEIIADFPLTLIGTAIIFPIVFSISGAYKRRESALREYGNIKAHGRALFFATRDWLPEPDSEVRGEIKDLLAGLLKACRELFHTPVDKMDEKESQVYASFSKLSRFIKSFRDKGLPSGEVSRCNQFLSKMIVAFENVKHIFSSASTISKTISKTPSTRSAKTT